MTNHYNDEWLESFDCRDCQKSMVLHCFDLACDLYSDGVNKPLIRKIVGQWLGGSDEIYSLRERGML